MNSMVCYRRFELLTFREYIIVMINIIMTTGIMVPSIHKVIPYRCG